MLEQYDIYSNIDEIHQISWQTKKDFVMTLRVGQRVGAGKISRITINTAGHLKYREKSYVVYIERDGLEMAWKVIEGFPVELTLKTDESTIRKDSGKNG